ncbi:MAG: hypothetical protein Roseis2KO_11250 [Roseivirga sp.]
MKRLFPLLLIVLISSVLVQQKAEAQVFSTKLKITIVDALGNVVQDAKVRIFKNEADYTQEANDLQPFQLTNAKGQVTFKKLEAASYYILVRKGDLDNTDGGSIVDTLKAGKVNKVNIVITDGL